MNEQQKGLVEHIVVAIESAGVLVLVVGAIAATVIFLNALPSHDYGAAYHQYRRHLGQGILLGLEFLVLGDIIRTVAIDPTPSNVGVLAGVVLIRTFLSFSLTVEIEGRWPWQRGDSGER